MSANPQESLFGPLEATPPVGTPFPCDIEPERSTHTYEHRVSAAYADLGGGVESDIDDEPTVPSLAPEAEQKDDPNNPEKRSRWREITYALARVAEDQAYWNQLQLDLAEGRISQRDFMSEWEREMNRRWKKRSNPKEFHF